MHHRGKQVKGKRDPYGNPLTVSGIMPADSRKWEERYTIEEDQIKEQTQRHRNSG